MSAESGAGEQEPNEMVGRRDVDQMIISAVSGLRQETNNAIERAISRFKSNLEREHEQQGRDKYYKQSELWFNRIVAAAAGFVISIVFTTTFSQCSELHSRITTLELKK